MDLTAQVKARTPKPVSPDEAVSPGPLLPALVISGYVHFVDLASHADGPAQRQRGRRVSTQ